MFEVGEERDAHHMKITERTIQKDWSTVAVSLSSDILIVPNVFIYCEDHGLKWVEISAWGWRG